MLCVHYFLLDNTSFNSQNCFAVALERLRNMPEDSTSHSGVHHPLTGPQDSFGCPGWQGQTFYDNTEALAFFSVLVQEHQWVRVPPALALFKVVAAKKVRST